MQRILAVVGILLLFLTGNVYAQQKKIGIGVVLGTPTGFSVKYWESPQIAYQGVLGGDGGGVVIGGDYLIHSRPFKEPNLHFYYGPGILLGGAKRTGRNALALRGVFGIDYLFPQHPFDLAVELGPTFFLIPTSAVAVDIGVVFRFYP